jgi:hypothetical protein
VVKAKAVDELNAGTDVNKMAQPAEKSARKDEDGLTLLDLWPLPPPFSVGTFLRTLKNLSR